MVTRTWRSVVLLVGETGLLVLAVALATYLRLREDAWTLFADPQGLLRVLLIVVVCQLCLHYADLYDLRTIADSRDLLVRLFQALGATSLILAGVYFWFPEWVIGRGVFLFAAVLVISLLLAWRLAFAWLTRRIAPRERLLLVGTNPASIDLARELFQRRQELGVEIVGFVDPDPSRLGAPVLNPGVVGTIDDIPQLVSRLSVDRVVVSLAEARGRQDAASEPRVCDWRAPDPSEARTQGARNSGGYWPDRGRCIAPLCSCQGRPDHRWMAHSTMI